MQLRFFFFLPILSFLPSPNAGAMQLSISPMEIEQLKHPICSYKSPRDKKAITEIMDHSAYLASLKEKPTALNNLDIIVYRHEHKKTVGFLAYKIIAHTPDEKLYGNYDEFYSRIKYLEIAKDFRNRGYGKALLTEALLRLKSNGINEVELDVHRTNLPGVQLYKKMGFTRPFYFLFSDFYTYRLSNLQQWPEQASDSRSFM